MSFPGRLSAGIRANPRTYFIGKDSDGLFDIVPYIFFYAGRVIVLCGDGFHDDVCISKILRDVNSASILTG